MMEVEFVISFNFLKGPGNHNLDLTFCSKKRLILSFHENAVFFRIILHSSIHITDTETTTIRILYISLTVHRDINQFVITNLMHICFIS
jgi:hypothetical protein